jgi:SAM-dependent methyltransferase
VGKPGDDGPSVSAQRRRRWWLSSKARLVTWMVSQEFRPGRWGWLVNPFWLTRRALYLQLATFCPRLSGRVLDLGCGTKPYRRLFSGAACYVGVEVRQPGHNHTGEPIDVFYDGRSLPLASGSFDVVFASEVLEHVFEPDGFLREVHRVLRPSGTLLVTLPFVWAEHEEPQDFARYTSFGVRGLLERTGFAVRRLEKTGSGPAAIAQLAAAALHSRLPRHPWHRRLLQPATSGLIQVCGALLEALGSRGGPLFLNTVALAERLPGDDWRS